MSRNKIFTRLILPVVLLLHYCPALSAQSKKVDSLMTELENAKIDSVKLKVLLKLSFELRANNSEKSLKYAQQSLTLARTTGRIRDEARAYNNIGLAFFYKSQYDSALHYYRQTLNLGRVS